MKTFLLYATLISALILFGFKNKDLTINVEFATVQQAKELLTTEDKFTESWSQFDIDSRMRKNNSTKEELFEYISEQAREWTPDQKEILKKVIFKIQKQISKNNFQLNFPGKIVFIKTTTKEEGNALAYTRSNYIVLNEKLETSNQWDLERLVAHELFHILSRNNPEFRKSMYGIIGFKLMNNIDYPETIKKYRITNPDAPHTDNYITLKINDEVINCMMILFSKKAYESGDFFEYLNIGFLKLTGNEIKSVELRDNNPTIYSLKEVSNFFEQVGKNTNYIIHPEEIMAENFSFALMEKKELKNPDIINKIRIILKE